MKRFKWVLEVWCNFQEFPPLVLKNISLKHEKLTKLLVNLPIVNKLLQYLFSKTLTIKVKNKPKNYKINCWIPQVTVLFCDSMNKQVSKWMIWSVRAVIVCNKTYFLWYLSWHFNCCRRDMAITAVVPERNVANKCHTIPSNNVKISFWGLALKGGQSKMQTVDWLWTIVFRVRKQWHYCCYELICMVKTIICSLRFTMTSKRVSTSIHLKSFEAQPLKFSKCIFSNQYH